MIHKKKHSRSGAFASRAASLRSSSKNFRSTRQLEGWTPMTNNDDETPTSPRGWPDVFSSFFWVAVSLIIILLLVLWTTGAVITTPWGPISVSNSNTNIPSGTFIFTREDDRPGVNPCPPGTTVSASVLIPVWHAHRDRLDRQIVRENSVFAGQSDSWRQGYFQLCEVQWKPPFATLQKLSSLGLEALLRCFSLRRPPRGRNCHVRYCRKCPFIAL